MKKNHLLAGVAALALLAAGAPDASATPIPLGGTSGPITIKFQNLESFTKGLTTGSQNFGIFQITSILNSSGSQIYAAPVGTPTASNPLIVGVFSGIVVTGVTGTHTTNSGGTFSLYDDTTTKFGAIGTQGTSGYTTGGCTVLTEFTCYNGITNKGFDNILNISLVPGASGDSAAALASTLYTSISSFSPLTGGAQGFGDVTGGSDAGQIAKGTEVTALGTPADIFLQDDFCTQGQKACNGGTKIGNWLLESQDPIQTAVIPEPGSLLMLGSALAGLGAFFRRRRKTA